MLDLDTVATFMITFVTQYFARCGESLETMLDDNCDSNAASFISPPKKQKADSVPDEEAPKSVDALSICQSFDICHSFEVDDGQQPFAIQKMDGTDLIFFPRPSSETPYTNRPLIGMRNPSYDVRTKPVALGNGSHLRKTENDVSKTVISPSTEVVSKWIADGMSKENFNNSVPTHHQQQQFPFDEMKTEIEKSVSRKPPLGLGTLGTQQSRFHCGGGLKQQDAMTKTAIRNSQKGIIKDESGARTRGRNKTTKPTPTTSSLQQYMHSVQKLDDLQESDQNQSFRATMSSHWKEATDTRTGLTYYYHEVTKETQWRKPLCMASADERLAIEEKEQKKKDFFAVMEANIMNSLSLGVLPGTSEPDPPLSSSQPPDRKEIDWAGSSPDQHVESLQDRKKLSSLVIPKDVDPNLIRTISAMEETILKDVIRRQPSFRAINARGGSREPSLDLDEMFRSNSSIENWGNNSGMSQLSFRSNLATLDEDTTGASPGASPGARSNNASKSDLLSCLKETSTDDLSWTETEALTKLVSLTNKMIQVDKDIVDKNGAPLPSEKTYDSEQDRGDEWQNSSRAFRRGTDGDIERSLPRELDFEDSDDEEEEPRSLTISRHANAAKMNSRKPTADRLRPGIQRRNTCGTMYIRSTMSAPDNDATIRCVCGVYRSHILSSEDKNLSLEGREDYKVFNDYPDNVLEKKAYIPSLDEIVTFYRDVFVKAQMESDCIIMSLIYLERLIKKTIGRLRPRARNWRSLMFSCMILSSKVWDDMSMWNGDFSQSCPPGGVNFSLQRVNQLELAVLNSLKFNVKVPASEYAKYYFLLRSMLIKSGLGGEDLGSLDPLDVEGARRLQQVSSQFESRSLMTPDVDAALNRSKSLAVESESNARALKQPKNKVGLEQVVKMY